MDKELSELIRSLRLIMVMGLVFVHFGNFPGDDLDPFVGVVNAEYFVGSSINSFFTYFFLSSVPVLSLISGYLFSYRGVPGYTTILKKKTKTLVLPAIAWTSFWLLVAFTLYSIGKSTNQFTYYDQGFADYSILDFLNGIIGITDTPFAFQFWFIHDLVLSILFSPLFIYAIRKIGVGFTLVPFVLWILEANPLIFFNFKVLAFFILGLYFGVSSFKPTVPTKLFYWNLTIPFFTALVLLRIYIPALYDGMMPFDTAFELVLRVVGSVAIVTLTIHMKNLLPVVYKFLVKKSGYAFFLHAYHFPLVIIIKQILSMTGIFNGESGLMMIWACSVAITIVAAMITAEVLNRFIPPLYKFLNGQRSI